MKLPSMKLLATALLLPLLLLTACSSSQNASSEVISWQPYAAGLQAAGTQGKKTFLYFRADW